MKLAKFLLILNTFITITVLHARNTAHVHAPKSPFVISTGSSVGDRTFAQFCAPVECTPQGIRCFMKHVYNEPEFATEYLPHDWTHFTTMLEHSKKVSQPLTYAHSVVKLFHQKAKDAPYLNSYAYQAMMGELPALLEPCFPTKQTAQKIMFHKNVNDALYTEFLERFEKFQSDPNQFFYDLTTKIVSQAAKDQEQAVSAVQLQSTIVRFIELGISKIIWSPEEPTAVWESFKKISSALAALYTQNIITNAHELDDLYWSLITRFCNFISMFGSELPMEWYTTIKKELDNPTLSIFTHDEQDALVLTKAKRLEREIEKAEPKAFAHMLLGMSDKPVHTETKR